MTTAAADYETGVFRRVPEFLCHVKFRNTLPNPAVPSGLVCRPVDLSRFVPYRVSALERRQVHEAPFEILHSSMLDFVDLEKFRPATNEYLAAEDEVFLQTTEGATGGSAGATGSHPAGRRETQPAPATTGRAPRSEVTWLRRTEYLSADSRRSKGAAERLREDSGPPATSKLDTPEDVIAAIERSFATAAEPLRHPTHPDVQPVAVYPVLPNWEGPESFAQCTFDTDPYLALVDGLPVRRGAEQRALIKAMSNANDPSDTFVWYYLPTTAAEGEEEEEEGRMVYARDYDIQRVDHRQAAPYFVLSIPQRRGEEAAALDVAARYTPILGHFNLKKRRAKPDHGQQRHTLKISRRSG